MIEEQNTTELAYKELKFLLHMQGSDFEQLTEENLVEVLKAAPRVRRVRGTTFMMGKKQEKKEEHTPTRRHATSVIQTQEVKKGEIYQTRLPKSIIDTIELSEEEMIKEFEACLEYDCVPTEKRQLLYLLDVQAKKELIYFYYEKKQADDERKRKEALKIKKKEESMQNLGKSKECDENVKIPRDYTGWTVNFNSVFIIPEMQEAFSNHLKSEANLQPFHFLLEVSNLTNDTRKETVKQFISIVDRFLFENSENPLNISGSDRKKVIELRNSCRNYVWNDLDTPLTVLEPCKRTIYGDLNGDSFSRFKLSDEGYNVIKANAKNEYVISKSVNELLFEKIGKINNPQITKMATEIQNAIKLQIYYMPHSWMDEMRDTLSIPFKIALLEDPERKFQSLKTICICSARFEFLLLSVLLSVDNWTIYTRVEGTWLVHSKKVLS